MKHVSSILAMFGMFATPAPAQDAPLSSDYAYGYEITASSDKKSIIEVLLPEDVYANLTQPTMSDMAVFNSRGEAVPHRVIPATSPKSAQSWSTVAESLPLFPVYQPDDAPDSFGNVTISTSGAGTIVEVKGSKPTSAAKKQKLIGYVIDASRVTAPLRRFEIGMDPAAANYFFEVRVEASRDLGSWYPVVDVAPLAKFESNGEMLTRNTIEISDGSYKYFRLSWMDRTEVLKISTVRGLTEKQLPPSEEDLLWHQGADTKRSESGQTLAQIYDLGGFFPVRGVQVGFVDVNSAARLGFDGANSPEGPWQQVHSGYFHRLTRGSSDLSVLKNHFDERIFRYWRVRLESERTSIGNRFPEISFGWKPGSVRFLARGEGPFILAFGKADQTSNAFAGDLIPGGVSESDVAFSSVGKRLTFAGETARRAKLKTAPILTKVALWAALLIGVVALVAMALQVKKSLPPAN